MINKIVVFFSPDNIKHYTKAFESRLNDAARKSIKLFFQTIEIK
jgi:hypothetical protein